MQFHITIKREKKILYMKSKSMQAWDVWKLNFDLLISLIRQQRKFHPHPTSTLLQTLVFSKAGLIFVDSSCNFRNDLHQVIKILTK